MLCFESFVNNCRKAEEAGWDKASTPGVNHKTYECAALTDGVDVTLTGSSSPQVVHECRWSLTDRVQPSFFVFFGEVFVKPSSACAAQEEEEPELMGFVRHSGCQIRPGLIINWNPFNYLRGCAPAKQEGKGFGFPSVLAPFSVFKWKSQLQVDVVFFFLIVAEIDSRKTCWMPLFNIIYIYEWRSTTNCHTSSPGWRLSGLIYILGSSSPRTVCGSAAFFAPSGTN